MKKLRELYAKYDYKDIFNADNTILYQKLIPNVTLGIKQLSSGKLYKECIIIFPTYNTLGDQKLDLQILGKAANPRAFRKDYFKIKKIPFIYRNNKKAQITRVLFK